ncbi:MAG TPA: hypothetical protein VGH54_17910 [Mycobacterium sp.]|jgi:hypothetical protein|uniref:hypothetical protein n=1 Tax=Mycobacterium sp. TaxID=1785 RepID=UPI002F41FE43
MTDLTLICEGCRWPVLGDTGSLYVRLGEVMAAQVAQRDWDAARSEGTAVDVTELIALPDDVRWRAAHDVCRSDHAQGCYEIDAPQIAEWPHVARWTAHLMAKNWLTLTDWDDVLRELSGETPAKRIRVTARAAA